MKSLILSLSGVLCSSFLEEVLTAIASDATISPQTKSDLSTLIPDDHKPLINIFVDTLLSIDTSPVKHALSFAKPVLTSDSSCKADRDAMAQTTNAAVTAFSAAINAESTRKALVDDLQPAETSLTRFIQLVSPIYEIPKIKLFADGLAANVEAILADIDVLTAKKRELVSALKAVVDLTRKLAPLHPKLTAVSAHLDVVNKNLRSRGRPLVWGIVVVAFLGLFAAALYSYSRRK